MANPDFDDDLEVMFGTDDFAVSATLDGAASGNVILDRDYVRALGMVPSSNPVALAIASDYGTAVVGGTLVADGGTYVIRERQPQDDGALVLLQLEADPNGEEESEVVRFADNETPSGTIDGSNDTFTLAHTPVPGSLQLNKNGQLMTVDVDYTLSGTTITYVAGAIPQSGDAHVAFYRY